MAKPHFNDPIEPMDLANLRHNGARSVVKVNSIKNTTLTGGVLPMKRAKEAPGRPVSAS
jgi:hypothetical protein